MPTIQQLIERKEQLEDYRKWPLLKDWEKEVIDEELKEIDEELKLSN